ncbi:hypothetical protein KSP40_PGU015596 [Platanthera guangdongensis]|uniref:DUF1985 domain-containing protein n=1 Tax=Platanthera guangdongensis TaxID=2320717 RepID=A0ABR2MM78_9ASPA
MPGSSYLYSRCAIKTFKENAKSLLDVLSEDSKETLREIGILQLFNMPTIQQNIPLLYYIIRSYSARKNAFLLGKFYVKFTVNHVALILGLPNRGKEFQFDRIPLSNLKHKELVQELADLTVEDSSPTLESRRINALIRYVLAAFFFPLKGLKVPTCLLEFKGLEDFAAVNWPKAIHTFLYSHFAYMKEIAIGEEMKNLGYLEGCSVILVVWFLEHTSVASTCREMATPRLHRWSSQLTFSALHCSRLRAQLSMPNAVSSTSLFIGLIIL